MKQRILINDNEKIGVYALITPSNRIYVGMTCDSFSRRWNGHLKELKRDKHKSRGLQFSYAKYGWDSIQKIILEEWSKPDTLEELLVLEKTILKRERYWWEQFKIDGAIMLHGCPTGTGSVLHSEETNKRISNSNSNKISWNKGKILYNGEYVFISEVEQNCIYDKKPFHKDKLSKFCSLECEIKYSNLIRDRKTKIPLSDKDKIIKLYTSGMSLQEIGKFYGVSYRTVHYFMVKNDIPRRNLSESQKFSKIKCC